MADKRFLLIPILAIASLSTLIIFDVTVDADTEKMIVTTPLEGKHYVVNLHDGAGGTMD